MLGARLLAMLLAPCSVSTSLTTGGVEVPTAAAKQLSFRTRSHKNAFDAILTILHQQSSDMQFDVGRHMVQVVRQTS